MLMFVWGLSLPPSMSLSHLDSRAQHPLSQNFEEKNLFSSSADSDAMLEEENFLQQTNMREKGKRAMCQLVTLLSMYQLVIDSLSSLPLFLLAATK